MCARGPLSVCLFVYVARVDLRMALRSLVLPVFVFLSVLLALLCSRGLGLFCLVARFSLSMLGFV